MDRDSELSRRRSGVDPEAVVEPTGVVNGASWSGHERNHYWRNLGGAAFQEQSGISGADVDFDGRTFSLLDYDRDGWQDFVLVNANRPWVQLFRNRHGDGASGRDRGVLGIRLVGAMRGDQPGEASNRDGIGATVVVRAGGLEQVREFRAGEGLSGQNSATLYVGLGSAVEVDSLEVRWPSGRRSLVEDLAAGSIVTVHEDPGLHDGHDHEVEPLTPAGAPDLALAPPPAGPTPLGPAEPLLEELAVEAGAAAGAFRFYTTWFTTCQACKRAEPTYRALRRAFGEDQLAMIGINNDLGDSAAEIQAYGERFAPAYVLVDRDRTRLEAYKALQDRYEPEVRGDPAVAVSEQTPATILADAEGRVLATWIGVPDVSTLRRAMAGL